MAIQANQTCGKGGDPCVDPIPNQDLRVWPKGRGRKKKKVLVYFLKIIFLSLSL